MWTDRGLFMLYADDLIAESDLDAGGEKERERQESRSDGTQTHVWFVANDSTNTARDVAISAIHPSPVRRARCQFIRTVTVSTQRRLRRKTFRLRLRLHRAWRQPLIESRESRRFDALFVFNISFTDRWTQMNEYHKDVIWHPDRVLSNLYWDSRTA